MSSNFKEVITKVVKQQFDTKKPIVARGTKIAVNTRQISSIKVTPFSI